MRCRCRCSPAAGSPPAAGWLQCSRPARRGLGTVYAASTESPLPEAARRRIVAAHTSDTVYTRAFDTAAGYPWPAHHGERALANEFSARWTGREFVELARDRAAREEFARAAERGDHALVPINAGRGVGEVREIRPAADVIRELARGAAALLRRSHPASGADAHEPQRLRGHRPRSLRSPRLQMPIRSGLGLGRATARLGGQPVCRGSTLGCEEAKTARYRARSIRRQQPPGRMG
jgi:hypothetical protein